MKRPESGSMPAVDTKAAAVAVVDEFLSLSRALSARHFGESVDPRVVIEVYEMLREEEHRQRYAHAVDGTAANDPPSTSGRRR